MVQCSTGQLYTGITNDVERRTRQHNRGAAAKFTRGRTPVTLVYKEACDDRSAALKREYRIKRMSRKEKVALALEQGAVIRLPWLPMHRRGSRH